jgi:transcriptional regulator GlxA family with amidase domain
MAESVGTPSLTPTRAARRVGPVQERHVVIVAFEGLQPLDAVGPHEVFSGAGRAVAALGRAGSYRVTLASPGGAAVRAESGLVLGTVSLPTPTERIDTLVLSGGPGAEAAAGDESVLQFIRQTAPRCRRVATVCSGAFLGAAAGLFDGRRVTTHWARARQLAEAYPAITVDADPIYIRDGKYWSSAGVTAGIDLSLALVQEDLGVDVAQTVARWLVMFLHRPGGQTQFASPVWVPRAERSTIRAVQSLVEAAPGGDHRLPTLAAAAAMSVRHFTRVFTAEVGETPSRFVERTRLEAARRELQETSDTLDLVAARCGLGSAESLRRVFHKHLGVPPDAYRRRFRAAPRERTSA